MIQQTLKRDIEPYNEKGLKHGYHEYYETDGTIWLRAKYKNGLLNGYREFHDTYILIVSCIYSII